MAFDEGPIFVITGTIYEDFPHERFEGYDDGLDSDQIYESGGKMLPTVPQAFDNREATTDGYLLHSKRPLNPDNVKPKVKDMQMPTGYFKVMYRPATGSEPAQAIAFMLPYTFENPNMLVDFYDGPKPEHAF